MYGVAILQCQHSGCLRLAVSRSFFHFIDLLSLAEYYFCFLLVFPVPFRLATFGSQLPEDLSEPHRLGDSPPFALRKVIEYPELTLPDSEPKELEYSCSRSTLVQTLFN